MKLASSLVCNLIVAGLLLSAATAWNAPLAAEKRKAAVFDFELIDTSLEGEMNGVRADETKRLVMISEMLRRKLEESGRYVIVDHGSAAERISDAGYLHGCNGCEAKIARDLGAGLAITGTVQKVSNLILNINIYVRDATSGKRLRAMSADIRGNTDESWSHGIRYLVKNRFLNE